MLRELERAPARAAAKGLPEILPATIGEAGRILRAIRSCAARPKISPSDASRVGIFFDSRAAAAAVRIEVGNGGSASIAAVSPVPDCCQWRGRSSARPNDLLWERLRWLDERTEPEETE